MLVSIFLGAISLAVDVDVMSESATHFTEIRECAHIIFVKIYLL